MRNFSVAGLMAAVAILAVCLAALRHANELSAGVMLLVAAGSVGVAALGAIYGSGRGRPWCTGFALFAGGYLTLAFAPGFEATVQPLLGTTHMLIYAHLRVAPKSGLEPSGLADRLAFRQQLSTQPDQVRQIASKSDRDPAVATVKQVLDEVEGQINAIRGYSPQGLASTSPSDSQVKASLGNHWARMLPGAAHRDQFLRVGHCAFALLSGLFGGTVASRFRASITPGP